MQLKKRTGSPAEITGFFGDFSLKEFLGGKWGEAPESVALTGCTLQAILAGKLFYCLLVLRSGQTLHRKLPLFCFVAFPFGGSPLFLLAHVLTSGGRS